MLISSFKMSYLCIYEDSFGAKILTDDCALSKSLAMGFLPVFGSGLDICPFDYYLSILQYDIEHSWQI